MPGRSESEESQGTPMRDERRIRAKEGRRGDRKSHYAERKQVAAEVSVEKREEVPRQRSRLPRCRWRGSGLQRRPLPGSAPRSVMGSVPGSI